jgi:hypothetical protein
MSCAKTTFFQIAFFPNSFSGLTAGRRIEELGTDIESTLKKRIYFLFVGP